ncbi:MAG: hypothetical protein OEY29_08430 [Gammaproteobacteria bacterium]|nr:hypothetical protein [Gammaproteobacteria bacterium]
MINKTALTKLFVLLLLFTCNSAIASGTDSSTHKNYIELISETDEVSDLNGFQFISYPYRSAQRLAPYFGAGLVYVNLPQQNDAFTAIHAIFGADYLFIRNIGLNFEFGFDLGEYIISGGDEKGTVTVYGEQQNQVDFSFASGLTFKIDDNAYLKTYIRYHAFDGVFLPHTSATFFGAKFGYGF